MTEDEMAVEIGKLAGLDLSALRERWRTLYGSEPPQRMSKELMMRAVAYRMQENAFGGLSRATKARLLAAAERAGRTGRPRTEFFEQDRLMVRALNALNSKPAFLGTLADRGANEYFQLVGWSQHL